jgi:hypothetical protein
MSEPTRLLADADTTGFERELLRTWSEEQPSEEARERAKGLASIAAAGALGAAVGGSIAPKAAVAGVALTAKWLVLGSIVVVAASAGLAAWVVQTHDRARTAPPVSTTTATTTATSTATSTTTSTAISTASATSVSELPDAPVPRAPHDTLADQIATMDAIRAALAAGHGARALRLIDDYERRFPRGAFLEEAEALRVEALARSGDAASASHAARRFLAAHPGSPHAARVRALLGSASP